MRRFLVVLSLVVVLAACLLARGRADAGMARPAVGAADAAGFEIDGDEQEEAEDGVDEETRPPYRDDRPAAGRHRHHGGRAPGGPHHRHHPGMGPHGGPDGHHHAMQAFREIIRRLGRIEEKLGIETGPPPRPEGDRPRRPRPEAEGPRGQRGDGGRPLERLDLPEDVRRQMEERMQEGRQRMAEAKERMEQARQKFQAMERRLEQLEAEVERLKAPR